MTQLRFHRANPSMGQGPNDAASVSPRLIHVTVPLMSYLRTSLCQHRLHSRILLRPVLQLHRALNA